MVRKIITLIVFLLFFSFLEPYLFAQDLQEIFGKFIGVWETTYQGGTFINVETMTNKWVHYGEFFQSDIVGNVIDDPDVKFSSTILLTLDFNGSIIAWAFDDGGYARVLTYKGKVSGNKVTLIGTKKETVPDFTYIITFEIKDGNLINERELKINRKRASYFEVVYTKKK